MAKPMTKSKIVAALAETVDIPKKTSAAYLDWQARTHTANGRVAVWLRLVPEPTGAMAIYDRPHPRS